MGLEAHLFPARVVAHAVKHAYAIALFITLSNGLIRLPT